MAKQIRVEISRISTNEYSVQLFLDGTHRWEYDYFTDNLEDAKEVAKTMEKHSTKYQVVQEDFCKSAKERSDEKAATQKQKLNLTEWPIYDNEGELIGWLSLEEKAKLPQILNIQDQVFTQIKVSKIAC